MAASTSVMALDMKRANPPIRRERSLCLRRGRLGARAGSSASCGLLGRVLPASIVTSRSRRDPEFEERFLLMPWFNTLSPTRAQGWPCFDTWVRASAIDISPNHISTQCAPDAAVTHSPTLFSTAATAQSTRTGLPKYGKTAYSQPHPQSSSGLLRQCHPCQDFRAGGMAH